MKTNITEAPEYEFKFVGPEEIKKRIESWAEKLKKNPYIKVHLFEGWGSANSPIYCDIPVNTEHLFNPDLMGDKFQIFFNYKGDTEFSLKVFSIDDMEMLKNSTFGITDGKRISSWSEAFELINDWVKYLESKIPEAPQTP